jgi:hypothetical protein
LGQCDGSQSFWLTVLNQASQTLCHPDHALEHAGNLKEHGTVCGPDAAFVGQIILADGKANRCSDPGATRQLADNGSKLPACRKFASTILKPPKTVRDRQRDWRGLSSS